MSEQHLLPLLLAVALAACTPAAIPVGPAVETPRLDRDALVTADGTALPLRRWLPEGGEDSIHAVVLALHGMNDYSNAFTDPGRYLAFQGVAVYAYDQRGFGNAPGRGFWAGTDTLKDDALTAARLIEARHPGKPLYLLGESMGGAVAMLVAADSRRPPLAGVVLAAPAVWNRASMILPQRALLWLTAHTLPGMTLTGRHLGIMPSDNLMMLRDLSLDPLVIKGTRVDVIDGVCNLMDRAHDAAPAIDLPVLILYGAHDQIVPKKPVLFVMRRFKDGTPAYYAQGWHMLLRDLDAGLVLDDITAWIADPTRPLPSGADARARTLLAGP